MMEENDIIYKVNINFALTYNRSIRVFFFVVVEKLTSSQRHGVRLFSAQSVNGIDVENGCENWINHI